MQKIIRQQDIYVKLKVQHDAYKSYQIMDKKYTQ